MPAVMERRFQDIRERFQRELEYQLEGIRQTFASYERAVDTAFRAREMALMNREAMLEVREEALRQGEVPDSDDDLPPLHTIMHQEAPSSQPEPGPSSSAFDDDLPTIHIKRRHTEEGRADARRGPESPSDLPTQQRIKRRRTEEGATLPRQGPVERQTTPPMTPPIQTLPDSVERPTAQPTEEEPPQQVAVEEEVNVDELPTRGHTEEDRPEAETLPRQGPVQGPTTQPSEAPTTSDLESSDEAQANVPREDPPQQVADAMPAEEEENNVPETTTSGRPQEEREKCSICLDYLERNSSLIFLRTCKHYLFHSECILRVDPKLCPLCRRKYNMGDMFFVNMAEANKLWENPRNEDLHFNTAPGPTFGQRSRLSCYRQKNCFFIREVYKTINALVYGGRLPKQIKVRNSGKNEISLLDNGKVLIEFKDPLSEAMLPVLAKIKVFADEMGVYSTVTRINRRITSMVKTIMVRHGCTDLFSDTWDSVIRL